MAGDIYPELERLAAVLAGPDCVAQLRASGLVPVSLGQLESMRARIARLEAMAGVRTSARVVDRGDSTIVYDQ
jgi:hypothetical protein